MSGMDDLIEHLEKEKAKSIKERENAEPSPNERRSKWQNGIDKFYHQVEGLILHLLREGLVSSKSGIQKVQVKDPDIKETYTSIAILIFPGEKRVVISPKEIGQIEISGPVGPSRYIMLGDDGNWYTNDTLLNKDTFADLIKSAISSE